MVRIKNPDILRDRIRKIEAKIKAIVERRYNGYTWNICPIQRNKVELLLIDRSAYLNKMFLATPEEVSRFENLNEKLIKMADDMRSRAAMLWETMTSMKTMESFDDDYTIEGKLRIYGWNEEDEVLRLPEDEYYGSDFHYMSEIIHEFVSECVSQAHCTGYLTYDKLKSGDIEADEGFYDTMEDGVTWAEGPLLHPAFSHICICYPIHDICTHNHYSIPDLLRINDFKTTVSLTIEHQVTQSGVRLSEQRFLTVKE